jgi:hypothetical protein
MARIRTVDFLPEIFQTPVNKQFLSATLDQLVQEPKFEKTQGYVGRRVGPGVNPNDKYVVEPTKARNDYQLEPGVISKNPTTGAIEDAIVYPGINDAIKLQGGIINNADRLYTSEYYTWDPFIDFDKFVNYNQYYWLPGGPDDVDVSATSIPLTDNFVVTRENGVYKFGGLQGNNPVITLVRGGNYTFQVAQNDKETVNFRVQNNGTSSYVIDYQPNPTLTLVRGNTYNFDLSLNGPFAFYIKTALTLGTTNLYNNGVSRNGAFAGTISFTVPQDAPDVLYYLNSLELNMRGQINIVDAVPGTGPGFWIQADPGITGKVPSSPNISSRDVMGVSNNGEDLGIVSFNVPYSTAQNFYYDLTEIDSVDLVSNLLFDQVNGQLVTDFLATYNGIDGINNIDGRTVIFSNDIVPPNIYRIQYVDVGGNLTIQLTNVLTPANLEKFFILFGTQYASTQWYKTAEGVFQQIPLLTAIKNTLWYQDGTDPEIFGRIKLIDQTQDNTLDINEIIGKADYTSPNNVIFTNGLKVTFRGNVEPAEYANNTYYVEGVGTAIKLLPVGNFVTPELYTNSESIPYDSTPYDVGNYDATLNAPQVPDYLTINRAALDLDPWSRSNRWFHIDVINATAAYNNQIPTPDQLFRAKRPIIEFRAGTKLFNFGTEGKQPVDVIDFAETDALSNIAGTPSYSVDGYQLINGSRVIFAADVDPQVRNKIYQVEFITPDPSPITSSSSFVAGYTYQIVSLGTTNWNAVAGTAGIIYEVNDTVKVVSAQPGTGTAAFIEPIIDLIPASDATVLINQSTVCLSGTNLQGKSFYFDGINWIATQQKTAVNQAPLFDIYDQNGISLSNTESYPSTTFAGSKLFSYAVGAGVLDPVLGFPLQYRTLANLGDIVFDNNLYKDTFDYVLNSTGITAMTSEGFVRQYSTRTDFVKEIGWQPAITPSLIRQQFQFVYDGGPLRLDIPVEVNNTVPSVQLFVGSKFQNPDTYTVSVTGNVTTIILLTAQVPGDVIEVNVLSSQTSAQGFYQVPINLENNPLNVNSETLTLGTVRIHYGSIAENLLQLQGDIYGPNNTRDLGNIVPYGLQILQQSSPLTLTGYFMRSKEYDIFSALEYNNREYIKFKSQLLETVIRNDYGNATAAEILDEAVLDITKGRTDINPFYWSDMLPCSSNYIDTVTTVTPITTSTFSTIQTYNFTSANYLALMIYLNGRLLVKGLEYTVADNGPRVTITVPLSVGDVVTIREYPSTIGNFVPNTPTKMGLYDRYQPRIYLDTSYLDPTTVIQGHDGSITVTFGDIRDQVLLEFETRIYNNLKTDENPVPLTIEDVAPGFFRTTDYTQTEINNILSDSFLSWIGWNKIDYKLQDYQANNEFTYNYSTAGNRINGQPLLGAWRGINRYFYDTETPNTTPWEMLGFSEEPTWWTDTYGPAPYTSDNLVLWDDLAAGYVADPITPYFKSEFARPASYVAGAPRNGIWVEKYGLGPYPSLFPVIPTGSEGQLLSPLNAVVGNYDASAFRKSWVVGDGGPAEAAWWSSSSYPFAVMRLLALTRPAEFFSLFADRDLYRYNNDLEQYLYNGRYRLDANGLEIYGNGVSKASYINWIVDYNQQLGRNSTNDLTAALQNLEVRLCYRMASYTDKQYVKIYTSGYTPDSQNPSLALPDESYSILLYKNQPFANVAYSSLIVERTVDGYAVYGYNTVNPYFEILESASNGLLTTVSAGGATVRVPTQYTQNIVQVPYGNTFSNTTVVVDFILSYGAYLQSQGLVFDDVENGYTLNWNQMAQEFLYFSQQGWQPGTMINLNPVATTLKAFRPGAVVDSIESITPENMLLDQNRVVLPTRDLIVDRFENSFSVTSTTNQTISYLNLKYTNYEHMIVLDNISVFNDLIYDPVTAARQSRIRLVAATTTEWNGQIDAQGFILNQNNIREWQPNRKYTKGEIVLYKRIYWSAQTIVQPKAEFDYADWVKSDFTKIQQGLLPNIANKADQLANTYNVNGANLERDNDLLSYGLIGFRPREYMQGLNLNDVSQVNVYKQFLGTKGTIRSAELFKQADLGKEDAEYDIYENWGVLISTYGANANRSFFELRLNEALLPSNPSTVQVIEPQQSSQADQTILLENIWRSSINLTSTDILPTTYDISSDTALPSAGYVNLNDVDISVFSLNDPDTINKNLDTVGVGTIIWVAKTNSYDWNIYRVTGVPGKIQLVSDNLDGTSLAQFTTAHGLSTGDTIIIRYFDDNVNGVYRVISTPTVTTVVIAFSFANTNQTSLSGNGLAFYLTSARVSQPSEIASLPYVNLLTPGARAWIDNNGDGQWQVVEKQNPFTKFSTLDPELPVVGSQYGSSLAQSLNNFSALVGAPSGTGKIYAYKRDPSGAYVPNIELTLNATGVAGFGNAIEFGNQTWVVAGASNSNTRAGYAAMLYLIPNSASYITSQLLVSPDQDFGNAEFGYAVTISKDERWMYIGAPATNKVYAYARIDVGSQTVFYQTNGTTTTYLYSDVIQIDPSEPDQLVVSIGGQTQTNPTDYTLVQDPAGFPSGYYVQFVSAPSANQQLIINRREALQLDQTLYTEVTATGGAGSGAKFSVRDTRGVYSVTVSGSDVGSGYISGNTLTISGASIGGASPANNIVITLNASNIGPGGSLIPSSVLSFTGSGISSTTRFDLAPYLYSATNIYSFTVLVNDQIQRPHLDYEFNSDSSLYANEIEFLTVPPAGALISVIANTYWEPIYTISTADLPNPLPLNARFGQSIDTTSDGRQVIIGCPFDISNNGRGSTYVFDRSVIRYVVDDVDQTTYNIPGSIADPVVVSLNGTFLINSQFSPQGQFTVVGSTIVLNLDNVTTAVGDFLEIETNQFELLQELQANNNNINLDSGFGSAVTVCPTNCSLYIGAPFDGTELAQNGSVTRRVNQSRIYGVITSLTASPSLIAGNTIRINNTEVAVPAVPNNTVVGLASAINLANIPNVVASVQAGLLTIAVKNTQSATPFNKLTVLPGVVTTVAPSTFDRLGFNTYAWTQTITSPNPKAYGQFGASLSISSDAVTLVVGAPRGDVVIPMVFDDNTTYFDDRSTSFFSPINDGGVVYTYNYFNSASDSISDPGQFAFGQQIYDTDITVNDKFGSAVSYVSGRLLVGSPQHIGTSSATQVGQVTIFDNPNDIPAWQIIHAQQPVVDVDLIDSVYTYNQLATITDLTDTTQTYFDFFDPLQGKILGAARRNIDYIGAVDPASYNVGTIHNLGNSWADEHVGEIWWDIDTVRFIDPNQDDIVYASRRWGQTFPGSRVDIYQWISSAVPPSVYTGPGIPLSLTSYTVKTALNQQNIIETRYYFWARGLTTIETGAGKTLSTTGIANYIENPRGSGIPYIAALNSSTVALYNAVNLISAADTILHIGYDREYTDAAIHQEYQLIAAGRADSFLSNVLYRKLQDSFCGVDTRGGVVPDPFLSPAERYGVQFRPRQSMFANRLLALENYLGRANKVLALYPITETRRFNLLNSAEPIPPSQIDGDIIWNKQVVNLEELGYQDFNAVPAGYLYLVDSDSSQNGLWTIYQVVSGSPSNTVILVRVQNYDTRRYWYHIDWYLPGYNSSISPILEVPNVSSLDTLNLLTAPIGSSVRVSANAQGKFEIYLRSATGWDRVGLQDGTIQFKEDLWNYVVGGFGFDVEPFDTTLFGFDSEPVIETRKIIQAINEELFIDDLAIERNNNLMLVFNYVFSEFNTPNWLIKTSLIDVDHRIRALLPFQNYLQDNQTFVLDYIQEVKPYHVQIREFNLTYDGSDDYPGMITDYDNPAFFNSELEQPQFVSPVLQEQSVTSGTDIPYTLSKSTVESTVSDTLPDAEIWTLWPWSQWFGNYLLELQEVTIVDGGVGYTIPPQVVVSGPCIVEPILTASVNSAGQVVAVNIVDPGQGFSAECIITFVGGNGIGARAVAVLENNLVRNINTTIKYDRCEYRADVVDWQANVIYPNGTLVRYINLVWQANNTQGSSVTGTVFNPADWLRIDASDLGGADRTMGFYNPTADQPGISYPLLVEGVEYPGVQVYGLDYNQEIPLNVIYQSSYLDLYLGTRPTDINVDGGEYIDTFSSYAPEELVPGSEFDTLDLRVYTTPGSDWLANGHGFPSATRRYTYDPDEPILSFDGLLQYPKVVILYNLTLGLVVIPASYDWVTYTLDATGTASPGDVLEVYVAATGGGNQLYNNTYIGSEIGNTIIVPFPFYNGQAFPNSTIYQCVIYNGQEFIPDTEYTLSAYDNGSTQIQFNTTFDSNDRINLTVLGWGNQGPVNTYSWSLPVIQLWIANGSLSVPLTNSLQGTNPANIIVTRNGVRARPSEGIKYIGDGSTTTYDLPSRGGYVQNIITDNDVTVYVNNTQIILNVDYTVNPYVVSVPRTITFVTAPAVGDVVLISVRTVAQYWIIDNELLFRPTQGLSPQVGDVIEITTWNDTSQQDLVTLVYQGPSSQGIAISQAYDTTDYDSPTVADPLQPLPGVFDETIGTIITTNVFDTGIPDVTSQELFVTLNGNWLFEGYDYVIQESNVVILGPTIGNGAVVAITTHTGSVVSDAMAFRIFQDMRGVQEVYRITPVTTTTLVEPLGANDDIIYVKDASKLGQPNTEDNIWGIITIDGERIMYRERDLINNTVSSLMRGTAGTAASSHAVDSEVYDMGRGNLLPLEYQNYVTLSNTISNGITTIFEIADLTIESTDTAAVEVYVGGTRLSENLFTVTSVSPVQVTLDNFVPSGIEVTVLVRQGVTWYAPGPGTPSNGIPLQNTDTRAARFLQGR